MLETELLNNQDDDNGFFTGDDFNPLDFSELNLRLSNEELREAYSVSISSITVLLFYAIGLGTIILSSLVPIIYITRLNPKRILM